MNMRFLGIFLLFGSVFMTPQASAEKSSNLRAGFGMVMLDTTPAVGAGQSKAFSLFLEMPEGEHSGSRFLLYGKKDTSDESYWGVETQIFWGIGLNKPGFRAYTGPAWHYEKHRFAQGAKNGTFYGWGWNTGIGLQIGRIQFDLAGNYRDNSDYPKIQGKYPKVWLAQLLLGYQF